MQSNPAIIAATIVQKDRSKGSVFFVCKEEKRKGIEKSLQWNIVCNRVIIELLLDYGRFSCYALEK